MKAEVELKQLKHSCTKCGNEDDIEVEVHRKTKEKQVIDDDSDLRERLEKLENARAEPLKVEPPTKEDLKKEKEKKPTIKGPPHIKKGRCKNCGKLHDNANFEGEAKGKCDNCNSYFTNRSKGKCPYCKPGEIESLDDDDRAALELLADSEDEEDEDTNEREEGKDSHDH